MQEVDCAAMLRRLIKKGPPTTLIDADTSLELDEDEKERLFECVVSCDGKEWTTAVLKDAPKSYAERDALWEKLRQRESELPEHPENGEDADVATALAASTEGLPVDEESGGEK